MASTNLEAAMINSPSSTLANLGPERRAETEKLLTYRAAAEALGVPYYKIQRAARAGAFPTYRVFNGRQLLKLSEVIAVIDASREGAYR